MITDGSVSDDEHVLNIMLLLSNSLELWQAIVTRLRFYVVSSWHLSSTPGRPNLCLQPLSRPPQALFAVENPYKNKWQQAHTEFQAGQMQVDDIAAHAFAFVVFRVSILTSLNTPDSKAPNLSKFIVN